MPSPARAWPRLLVVLLAGAELPLRLIRPGAFLFDTDLFRAWAARLLTVPPARFYDSRQLVDHLPGDLWILNGIAHLERWLGGAPAPPAQHDLLHPVRATML